MNATSVQAWPIPATAERAVMLFGVRFRRSATLVLGGVLLLASCGTASSDTSISATGGDLEPVASTPPADLAPSKGASTAQNTRAAPQQLPFEKFLGVPSDPVAAQEWDTAMVEFGIRECMEASGFNYIERTSDMAVDPNVAVEESLGAEQRIEYQRALYGETLQSGVGGCTRAALDRAHPLNAFPEEMTALERAVYEDPIVLAASQAKQACLDLAGWTASNRDISLEGECDAKSNWTTVAFAARSELEEAFIENHREELEVLRSKRPAVAS